MGSIARSIVVTSEKYGGYIPRNKRNYTQSLIAVNVPQHDLLLSCFFGMANLRIAQPLLLSGPIQNSFKSSYFWLKFLSD